MSILGTILKLTKPGTEEDLEPSVVRDVVTKPDSFKLEAEVVEGELVIKIKRRNNQ